MLKPHKLGQLNTTLSPPKIKLNVMQFEEVGKEIKFSINTRQSNNFLSMKRKDLSSNKSRRRKAILFDNKGIQISAANNSKNNVFATLIPHENKEYV